MDLRSSKWCVLPLQSQCTHVRCRKISGAVAVFTIGSIGVGHDMGRDCAREHAIARAVKLPRSHEAISVRRIPVFGPVTPMRVPPTGWSDRSMQPRRVWNGKRRCGKGLHGNPSMCVEERFGTRYRAIHQPSDDRDKYVTSPRQSRVALKC